MIHIIGGGLAGSEAAWQAAELGADVTIHEMRAGAPDGRAPDRRPGRAGVQQFVSRRQDRQRRRPDQGRDAAARLDRDAGGGCRARARRRRARRRSPRVFRDRDRRRCRRTRAFAYRAKRLRACRAGVVAGHHRDRSADFRCAVAEHSADGRRGAPRVLRRDQPDRARRIDRHVEGVPRVALGPERLECQGCRWCLKRLECDRRGRLSELSDDEGRVRRVLCRARLRRIGDGSRFRQHQVLRRLPADRSDGASRRRRRCDSGR